MYLTFQFEISNPYKTNIDKKKNKRSNIDETIDENFVRYTVNIQCSFTPSIMKNSIINSRSRIAYLFRLFP